MKKNSKIALELLKSMENEESTLPKLKYDLKLKYLDKWASLFVQLDLDEETKEFLQSCYDKNGFKHLGEGIARFFLSYCLSVTDINGYLGRGEMFVFSKGHLKKLIDPHQEDLIYSIRKKKK